MNSANFQDYFDQEYLNCCVSNEVVVLCGLAVLLLVLISEFIDWGYFFPTVTCPVDPPEVLTGCDYYGYEDENGPTVWKELFPAACGNCQSPINIECNKAVPCSFPPLNFSCEYNCYPESMRLSNDGHCATLQMKYADCRPCITGGPLETKYEIFNVRFRWGPNDDEGSEHTIDYRRYAMEMQTMHLKTGCECEQGTFKVSDKDALVIVSYVFKTTTIDNPYLDPLVLRLMQIKYPGSVAVIPSFPLSWIMPAFVSDYFLYEGSLTFPPCTEGIQWIVQPEPLAISRRQIRKFRKLLTQDDEFMLTNTRPIQDFNKRDLFFCKAK